MKKLLLATFLVVALVLPVCMKAQVICRIPGGNVEIQSEYVGEGGYVVNVINDSDTDNANVRITISYKVGKETKTSTASDVALKASSTKIVVPCDSNATDIKITSISGTKCQKD